MTDYAKHIGSLNAARNGLHPDSRRLKALNAAIDLMSAAMPKDAEAERVHCEAVAGELLDTDIAGRWIGRRAHAAAAFVTQRAAARAEGVASTLDRAYQLLVHDASADMVHPSRALSADGQAYCDRLGEALRKEIFSLDPDYEKRIDAMQTELAAAKAENEQLRHWNEELRADAKQTYEAGLALGLAKDIPAALAYDLVAAKAEIERLRADRECRDDALGARVGFGGFEDK